MRQRLAAGDVAEVATLLARPFSISGVVCRGDARGRTIGFPTANLTYAGGTLWPSFGVYASWVTVDDERHPAAVNIGTRPTVYGASGVPLLEAHLLDFDGDLYDRRISVHFDRPYSRRAALQLARRARAAARLRRAGYEELRRRPPTVRLELSLKWGRACASPSATPARPILEPGSVQQVREPSMLSAVESSRGGTVNTRSVRHLINARCVIHPSPATFRDERCRPGQTSTDESVSTAVRLGVCVEIC